jgi:hypothetical protein
VPGSALPRATRLFLAGNAVAMTGNGLVIAFTLIYLHQARGIALPVVSLLCAGCLAAVAVGARLRRALTSDQDHVTEAPATRPEPVAGRRRAARSGTRG